LLFVTTFLIVVCVCVNVILDLQEA